MRSKLAIVAISLGGLVLLVAGCAESFVNPDAATGEATALNIETLSTDALGVSAADMDVTNLAATWTEITVQASKLEEGLAAAVAAIDELSAKTEDLYIGLKSAQADRLALADDCARIAEEIHGLLEGGWGESEINDYVFMIHELRALLTDEQANREAYRLLYHLSRQARRVRSSISGWIQQVNRLERLKTAPPTPAAPTVVIQELLPNPSGDQPDQEYIRLHNASDDTISVAGWNLTDGEGFYRIPIRTEIEPQGSWSVLGSTYNPTGDTKALFLANDGDCVRLLDVRNDVIDQCCYLNAEKDQAISCH